MIDIDIDSAYRQLATLATSSPFSSAPNPTVTALIYGADGTLIADGVHNRKLSPYHAEVVALKKAGSSAEGATIVVSLEPCNHIGSTGACVEAIIDAGIARVIYAVKDPNPKAAGGAQRLAESGIIVEFRESNELTDIHRAWLHRITTSRPYFIWKIATSLDGRIAASDGSSQWISSEQSRADVQLLRAQSDAILVGTGTVLADNPTLRPRMEGAASPLRIVMGESEIPAGLNIHDGKSSTLFVKSRSVDALMGAIADLPLNQVLVEAGPTLGSALMAAGVIDEVIIYQAPILLGAGKGWLEDIGITTIADAAHLQLLDAGAIGPDFKFRYRVEKK